MAYGSGCGWLFLIDVIFMLIVFRPQRGRALGTKLGVVHALPRLHCLRIHGALGDGPPAGAAAGTCSFHYIAVKRFYPCTSSTWNTRTNVVLLVLGVIYSSPACVV